jgi:phage terminase large subunit
MQTVKKLSDIVLPAYKDFWKTKKTYVVCKGSRGSGKSKHTALWHIYHMMKYPLANTLVVRKTERTLRDSCYSDLKWAIHQLGVDDYWHCTTSPLEMIYIPTGQKILFRGLDSGYKITSISVPKGVLCWLWFEEFYEINNEEDFDILDESIRGTLPEGYWKRITATFNPWSASHFSKKRFFDVEADNILSMTTTYKDNPYLSETDLQLFETMKKNNPRRYRVAGLGEFGIADGLIYENYIMQDFDVDEIRKIPDIKSAFNLDFGFTDPNAFVCELIDNTNMKIYIFDEWYKSGVTNKVIAQQIKDMGYGGQVIICDSAEPKSIAELRDEGIKAEPSRKGRDSVNHGIQLIQNYQIIIHPKCVEFYKEISNYCWSKDKDGKPTDKPDHEFSHGMDSMRYGVTKKLLPEAFSFD